MAKRPADDEDQRALREALEQAQKALQLQERLTAELRDRVSTLHHEKEQLEKALEAVTADRERLAKELLERALNPHQQGSAFSKKDVEALVAFLAREPKR